MKYSSVVREACVDTPISRKMLYWRMTILQELHHVCLNVKNQEEGVAKVKAAVFIDFLTTFNVFSTLLSCASWLSLWLFYFF
jgi:hypothetical protein